MTKLCDQVPPPPTKEGVGAVPPPRGRDGGCVGPIGPKQYSGMGGVGLICSTQYGCLGMNQYNIKKTNTVLVLLHQGLLSYSKWPNTSRVSLAIGVIAHTKLYFMKNCLK